MAIKSLIHKVILPLRNTFKKLSKRGLPNKPKDTIDSEMLLNAVQGALLVDCNQFLPGGSFKYRAKVWSGKKAKVGRWAWDVFLVSLPSSNGFTDYSLNTKFYGMQWLGFAGIFDRKIYSKCGS